MDSYIFFILHNFSLPLKPAIRRVGNAPRCKEQKAKRVSTLMYILLQDFQNFSRLLISELIVNVKYNFNIPFRVTLKIIIMRASTQFHRWCTVKFYAHSAQRNCFWIGFKAWSSLLTSANGGISLQNIDF